jgi:hypothetical protein
MKLICNELKFKDLQNDTEYLLIDSVLKDQKKYLAKLEKENNKNKKKNKPVAVRDRKNRKASKFAMKYKDRVESIQNSEYQTMENRKKIAEIEKMQAKFERRPMSATENKKTKINK